MKKASGYLKKRGNTFYACWQFEGKSYCRTTGESGKRAALKVMEEMLLPYKAKDHAATMQGLVARAEGAQEAAEAHQEVDPPLELIKGWLAFTSAVNRPDSGERTLRGYESQWGAFVSWAASQRPAVTLFEEVNTATAERYAAHLVSRRLSGNSYNKHVRLLAMVFKVLAKRARLTTNPWDGIGRKRHITQSRRELTVAELRAVCAAAQGELRTMIAIGLYSGLRLGDCATLRWSEVDLDRGIILRVPNKTARRNPTPVHIPIHPSLAGVLAEADRAGVYVLPRSAESYLRDTGITLSKAVQSLFKQCGIQTIRHHEGRSMATTEAGFHSLRHSFVSICAAAGVPAVVTEKLVGHSNPSMTRHYSHIGAEAAGAAIGLLPFIMGNEPKALPGPATAQPISDEIRALARRLDVSTIDEIKAALLALADRTAIG